MPQVNMTVLSSSPDVLRLGISAMLDLPELVSFPIDLGNLHAYIWHDRCERACASLY